MMNRILLFTLFYALVSINCNPPEEKIVHIRCAYMMYACGDNCPQYRILFSTDKKLVGNDIKIYKRVNDNLVDFRDIDTTKKCLICYRHEFWGTIGKNKEGLYIEYIKDSTYLKNNTCCDEIMMSY